MENSSTNKNSSTNNGITELFEFLFEFFGKTYPKTYGGITSKLNLIINNENDTSEQNSTKDCNNNGIAMTVSKIIYDGIKDYESIKLRLLYLLYNVIIDIHIGDPILSDVIFIGKGIEDVWIEYHFMRDRYFKKFGEEGVDNRKKIYSKDAAIIEKIIRSLMNDPTKAVGLDTVLEEKINYVLKGEEQ